MHKSALVLFSGGQDSTTCLAWSLARYARVETIGFDYGQRHRVELQARERVLARLRAEFPLWRARLGEDHVVDLRVLGEISDTALTREVDIELAKSGLPNTFETPLMWIDKAQTWQMALELGGQLLVDLTVAETHTCYLGERGERHAWGYGCGSCPACALRRRGYDAWSKALR